VPGYNPGLNDIAGIQLLISMHQFMDGFDNHGLLSVLVPLHAKFNEPVQQLRK
jgi:hypothetical protein